jgi:Ca2+-binding EF-hand superfamily protein
MHYFKYILYFLLLIIFAFPVSTDLVYAKEKMNKKCKDMDRNNDGVITREEWRISIDRSFDNHDWNGDGVLSGNEVEGGAPCGKYDDDESRHSDPFGAFDRNNDGVISRGEWTGTNEGFNRLDDDQNGVLSLEEFHERAGKDNFRELDHNNDGVIARNEWHNTNRSFEELDRNGDGTLNRDEFYNREQVRAAVFYELDVNNDGMISRSEWRSDTETFNRLDTNRDNLLSENEFYSRQSETGVLIEQIFQEIFKKR